MLQKRLTKADRNKIIDAFIYTNISKAELARQYNVSDAAINKLLKTHMGSKHEHKPLALHELEDLALANKKDSIVKSVLAQEHINLLSTAHKQSKVEEPAILLTQAVVNILNKGTITVAYVNKDDVVKQYEQPLRPRDIKELTEALANIATILGVMQKATINTTTNNNVIVKSLADFYNTTTVSYIDADTTANA